VLSFFECGEVVQDEHYYISVPKLHAAFREFCKKSGMTRRIPTFNRATIGDVLSLYRLRIVSERKQDYTSNNENQIADVQWMLGCTLKQEQTKMNQYLIKMNIMPKSLQDQLNNSSGVKFFKPALPSSLPQKLVVPVPMVVQGSQQKEGVSASGLNKPVSAIPRLATGILGVADSALKENLDAREPAAVPPIGIDMAVGLAKSAC
jgi:hypothetical protein